VIGDYLYFKAGKYYDNGVVQLGEHIWTYNISEAKEVQMIVVGGSYWLANVGYEYIKLEEPSGHTFDRNVQPIGFKLADDSGDGTTATNYIKFEAVYEPSSYTVTYKIVNGTWSDDSTEDKTENVESGNKPANVPTGMKASEGYTGGAWDVDPAGEDITEAVTFTYTFTAKQEVTVTTEPTANALTYSGSAQPLVTAGEATGGEMQYALGKDATTAPTDNAAWSAEIPTATDAGT